MRTILSQASGARRIGALGSIVILALGALAPRRVLAESAASAKISQKEMTEAERWDAAKESYKKAVSKIDSGDFTAALALFHEANEYFPGAAPKYGIALSLDRLGRLRECAMAYQAFLESQPDPAKFGEKIQEARHRLDSIKKRTFILAVVGVSLVLSSTLESGAEDVPLSMIPENEAAFAGVINTILQSARSGTLPSTESAAYSGDTRPAPGKNRDDGTRLGRDARGEHGAAQNNNSDKTPAAKPADHKP